MKNRSFDDYKGVVTPLKSPILSFFHSSYPEVENSELLGSDLCYTAMNFRKIGEAAPPLTIRHSFVRYEV